jgi:hypothetical protein
MLLQHLLSCAAAGLLLPAALQDVQVIRKRSFMRMPNTIAVSSSAAAQHGSGWAGRL